MNGRKYYSISSMGKAVLHEEKHAFTASRGYCSSKTSSHNDIKKVGYEYESMD